MGAVLNLPPAHVAWLVWGLGAALYLIAFYQRVAPAVLTQELTREFRLSAVALGNLSAFYFYSYVAGQIPTGVIADRWGPRKLLTAGAALTALGTLVFALAPSVAWANVGRLVIGAAAGVAFVSMLKIASHWMPARHFALASSAALFVGVMGATLAGAPMRFAVDAFGWRAVMVASAAFTALIAVAIWIVVRDDPSERGYASHYPAAASAHAPSSVLADLRMVLGYRNTWLLFFAPGGFSALMLAFAGLWGVPFLVMHYGFTTAQAAMLTSATLIAWSISGLAYGPLSNRIGRRKPVLIASLVASMAIWAVILFTPGLGRAGVAVLLLVLGVAAGGFILVFAFAKESVPARFGGTVSGVTNMGVMFGGLFMQPLIGYVLDLHWRGTVAAGTRFYELDAFRNAFSLLFIWGALSLILLALTRESHCRQRE